MFEGELDGSIDGAKDTVGVAEGGAEGSIEGNAETDGEFDGLLLTDGALDGELDGEEVGAGVGGLPISGDVGSVSLTLNPNPCKSVVTIAKLSPEGSFIHSSNRSGYPVTFSESEENRKV